MGQIKTVAVLTSGGDAPGMNAAIRAVVRAGIHYNMQVQGVLRGYSGLIEGNLIELTLRSVSDIIDRGGTMLFTARSTEFQTSQGVQSAVNTCRRLGIDALVVLGGDGSLKGCLELSLRGLSCVGVPCTIDNDVSCSDYTIGFDTAVNTATQMIDKLRDTAQSHERCSIVEVMGRNCGDIALWTGMAAGATAILVPEIPYNFEKDVIERIRFTQRIGKEHFIIIVAEGLGHLGELAAKIHEATGLEARTTVLGHVQRGGMPTTRDRVMASAMGCRAVEILASGKAGRVVLQRDGEILDESLSTALLAKKKFDDGLYRDALLISI